MNSTIEASSVTTDVTTVSSDDIEGELVNIEVLTLPSVQTSDVIVNRFGELNDTSELSDNNNDSIDNIDNDKNLDVTTTATTTILTVPLPNFTTLSANDEPTTVAQLLTTTDGVDVDTSGNVLTGMCVIIHWLRLNDLIHINCLILD